MLDAQSPMTDKEYQVFIGEGAGAIVGGGALWGEGGEGKVDNDY